MLERGPPAAADSPLGAQDTDWTERAIGGGEELRAAVRTGAPRSASPPTGLSLTLIGKLL